MDQELLNELKLRLEHEEKELEEELKEVSITTKAGHEPKPIDFGSDTEDFESEEADEAEDLGASLAVKDVLETRLNHVQSALRKIASGTYGTCEHCKKPLEEREAEIDPAPPECSKCSS